MPGSGISRDKAIEFQRLLQHDCGVEVTVEEAWGRASRLVALYRMLMEPIPEDPGDVPPAASGSNLDHLA
jgi:hypothetical protein